MGFKCPARKNIADFLQEVTSKVDQERYWSCSQSEYQYLSVEKLAESFRSFHVDQLIEANLLRNDTPNSSSATQLHRGKISKWGVFKACFARDLLLLKRNSLIHIFKCIQIAFMTKVTLTLFYESGIRHYSVDDGNKYLGSIFISMCSGLQWYG